MADILNSLITLGLLILLQAVLGFDNLLYISLESQRAPEADQSRVRKLGIGIANCPSLCPDQFGRVVARSVPSIG